MKRDIRFLNANAIKFLAALFMVIDHIGFLFFPTSLIWRYIGRISMPLFAFAIAEGCRYTKNKIRHISLIAALALVCQVVYYFFDNGSLYMCILVTFTLSITCIYALQYCKATVFDKDAKNIEKLLAVAVFCLAVAVVWVLNELLTIDYGFWGCMTPVFASLFDFRRIPAPTILQNLDKIPIRAVSMAIPLIGLCYTGALGWYSLYALLAIPLLFFYNGEKGKWKTKYFFYLFYPLHLVALEGVYMLIYQL